MVLTSWARLGRLKNLLHTSLKDFDQINFIGLQNLFCVESIFQSPAQSRSIIKQNLVERFRRPLRGFD
jgi:hypothetical protein